jgi:hypothetical protein
MTSNWLSRRLANTTLFQRIVLVLGCILIAVCVAPWPREWLLLRAVSDGNATVVSALLRLWTSPDAADRSGQTALLSAARADNFDMLRLLTEAGADPNVADRRGITPLMAASPRSPGVVEFLLKAGADPRVRNASGATALALATDGTSHGRESYSGIAAFVVSGNSFARCTEKCHAPGIAIVLLCWFKPLA